ncbi:hypothetical protein BH09MYX1_BH09MYX1_40000 [soil metagenome]
MERPIALPSRFRVLGELGSGARGTVLRVLDDDHGPTPIALKILHARSDQVRTRFPSLQKAAKNSASLVELFAWIETSEWHGFTMAEHPGRSVVSALRGEEGDRATRLVLGQRVEQPQFEPPTPELLARARHVFLHLARAVECLHDAGFVHGDLRPENAVVASANEDAEAEVTLLDLDGARPPDTPGDGLVATAWAAPELGQGESVFTTACDVYSLGTILFRVLTGDVPFSGSAQDVVLRKGTVSAPPASFLVRGIPLDLDDLCGKMLERAPSRRATIADVIRVLGVAVAESPRLA